MTSKDPFSNIITLVNHYIKKWKEMKKPFTGKLQMAKEIKMG